VGGACGEKRISYTSRLLVGKPEGKTPLGKPRCKWFDNSKINVVEMEWGGVGWVDLAQDRDKWRALMNVVVKLRVPKNTGKLSSGDNQWPHQ
jgi:hypothetical protein